MNNADTLKQQAAATALDYVTDGMVVGLGTGSTADFFLRELAARVAGGLRIVGVPTSVHAEARARELGIPLTTLDAHPRIDLTVDGADEVELAGFHVVKGRGGALLREKIVAVASDLEIIIVDAGKVVRTLGVGVVPVEVIPFGWQTTQARIAALGAVPQLRSDTSNAGSQPAEGAYVTDGGNFILDCQWPTIPDPVTLGGALKGLTGVVEHGLFIGLAGRIVVAAPSGVNVYDRPA
ncbi:MAG TPA: ribose-5-phosphate isomerase RpiA [Chloroflexia bacterium]|nr:ribose-5-phosphate isomerase RpiA [Chloroflexia bacterium]